MEKYNQVNYLCPGMACCRYTTEENQDQSSRRAAAQLKHLFTRTNLPTATDCTNQKLQTTHLPTKRGDFATRSRATLYALTFLAGSRCATDAILCSFLYDPASCFFGGAPHSWFLCLLFLCWKYPPRFRFLPDV